MIFFKCLACFTLFLCIANFDECLGLNLNCSESSNRKVDEIFARVLTFGRTGRKFPENDQQLLNYCSAEFSDLKSMGDYVKKCMTGLGKQMFQILGYTVRNHISKFCKKNARSKAEILSAGKCWNGAKDLYHKCNVKTIDNMLGIQNADDKRKIPLLCCQFYRIKNCYRESEQKISVCTERHSETTDQYVDSLTSSAFSLMCGDYAEDSSKCESLEAIPKKRSDQKRTRSFFVPAIGVFETLSEISDS